MHIPDGYLSTPVWVGMDVAAVAAAGLAARQVRRGLEPERVPALGMAAAFIFAGQMVNFPVAYGTTGHLLGGFLAALLLGPGAAIVVMATVVAVQCLLFQDGGLTALGANFLNIGVAGPLAGYGFYRLLRGLRVPAPLAIGAGAWLSVLAAAAAAGIEIGVSGMIPLRAGLTALLAVHALIGIGEAVITVGAVAVVRRARAGMLNLEPR